VTAASLDLTVEGAEEHGLDPAALERLAAALLAAEGVAGPCALGISFATEAGMRALNAEHRALDEVTDVLAFPLDGLGGLTERLCVADHDVPELALDLCQKRPSFKIRLTLGGLPQQRLCVR